MTDPRLSTLTLNTVDHVRAAAEHTLRAWQGGSLRLIRLLEDGMQQAARRAAAPLVPSVAGALERGSDRLGELARAGVQLTSRNTGRAITASSGAVQRQVRRLARLAGGVDNRLLARGLSAAARASVPGVRLAALVSERVAEGAGQVADRVADRSATAGRATTGARRSARGAAAQAKAAATTAAGKAAKTVKAATPKAKAATPKAKAATTQRKARAAVKAVAEAASAVADQVATEVQAATKPARRRAKAVVEAVTAD